jgi:hypothetical protein
MGDKGIVFKNRIGLYETELEKTTEDYKYSIMELNALELEVNDAHINLNKVSVEAINAGLTGTNQQQRDAQLTVLTEKERNKLNEAEKTLSVAKHSVDIASGNLARAKLNMQFIIAAMNAGFVVGCTPELNGKELDKSAKEFSEKFKS